METQPYAYLRQLQDVCRAGRKLAVVLHRPAHGGLTHQGKVTAEFVSSAAIELAEMLLQFLFNSQ